MNRFKYLLSLVIALTIYGAVEAQEVVSDTLIYNRVAEHIATQSNVTQHVDYSGGLSRIEQAIVAAGASGAPEGATWVFPIYIGGEHVDTIVLDAIDRNNYTTGGH